MYALCTVGDKNGNFVFMSDVPAQTAWRFVLNNLHDLIQDRRLPDFAPKRQETLSAQAQRIDPYRYRVDLVLYDRDATRIELFGPDCVSFAVIWDESSSTWAIIQVSNEAFEQRKTLNEWLKGLDVNDPTSWCGGRRLMAQDLLPMYRVEHPDAV